MNYLVYLVYGGEDYNNEALYSLLSYYNFHTPDENRVLIYSDDTAFFKQYLPGNVVYHELTQGQLTEWKGPLNYVHRVKVKVLQDVVSSYSGNILSVDTDTLFKSNIAGLFGEIEKDYVVFDKSEGRLVDNPGGIARKMRKFLKKDNHFILPSWSEAIEINETAEVWNIGVTGFNTSMSGLLLKTEELIDALYGKYQFYVMEQIAFNAIFPKSNTPVSAESYIHHYWYFKEFRAVLKHFFEHNKGKSFRQLQSEIYKIQPEYLSSEKRAYRKLGFWQRTWRKITTGRKWQLPKYEL